MLLEKLKHIKIVLGSQSPRRRELLSAMDLDFEVEIRSVEEHMDHTLLPSQIAEGIALAKMSAYGLASDYDKLIITADTIVVAPDGISIGKPIDQEHAYAMIESLSGQAHEVITGVVIRFKEKLISFSEITKVKFAVLDRDEISYYIQKYKPYDKAGAYGVQEWIGRIGLSHMEGSFENVMGLPTQRLYQELKKLIK